MIYLYIKLKCPDLDILETNILTSLLAEYYGYLRWDAEDKILKVKLNTKLNLEQKIILDNLIENL